MAIVLTDNRIIVSESDNTTGWTGSTGIGANTSSPTPVESTARLEMGVSNAIQNAYFTVSAVNMSAGHLIYIWVSHRAEFDTTANVGVGIQVGDGTNRVAYGIMGSDAVAFSHQEGPVVWQCLIFDINNRANYPSVTINGVAANLNVSAITQIGLYFKTIVKAVGGAVNCFWDIVRYLDVNTNDGCAITITGGTSGDPGTFEEISIEDREIGNQRAHGVLRKLGEGLYGVQGPLRFGNPTGTASSWFEDKNVSVSFESRNLENTKYKIVITGNGVGNTTFKLGTKIGTGVDATGSEGCNITVPNNVGGLFDASNVNANDVLIYGSTFSGFTQGIKFRSGHEFIGGIIQNSGLIEIGEGATLVNSTISNSTNSTSLLWNTNNDTSSKLDGCSFSQGITGHAIELGPNCPININFNDINFIGYTGTTGSNLVSNSGSIDAAIYNNSGKEITITISGGNIPSVRNGASASTIIPLGSPVNVEIQVNDAINNSNIQNARVLVETSSGVGDLPYNDTVTITRSGTIATVTHTAHGLNTGNKIVVRGANEPPYNGVKTITVIDTNSYTYTVNDSPATPATGTILVNAVIIEGLTDINGNISVSRIFSNNQSIRGRVRRSTTSPLYKPTNFVGIINNITGYIQNVQLIPDE